MYNEGRRGFKSAERGETMFGRKKCSLCGGKLVDNKCTLCGLDNSKSDASYMQNEKNVEKSSEKQTGKKKEESRLKKVKGSKQQHSSANGKSGKKVGKGLVAILVSVITVVGVDTIIDFVADIQDYVGWSVYGDEELEKVEEEIDYNEHLYDFVTRELSEEGEVYEEELSSGQYIVGVHIPEGTYQVIKTSDQTDIEYGYLIVDDFENSIYLGEDFTDPGTELSDVRCYSGAVIRISGVGNLHFYSENAQVDTMTGMANPLTEAVEVQNEFVAGVDFPAGVYDIVEQENPNLHVDFTYVLPQEWRQEIEDEGFSYQEEFLWITAENGPYIYRNLWLPEGTTLTIRGSEKLHLEPSVIVPEEENAFCHQNK